jgi:hypothetical protein
MANNRINYLNKDFDQLKSSLIRYARENFPLANQDFSEASSAGMLIELVAYAGDVMSFYIDHAYNEQFIDTANETTNIQRIAARYGYKIPGPSPAIALCKFVIQVPVLQSGNAAAPAPDLRAAPILLPGTIVQSNSGIDFTLTNRIDFTDSTNATFVAGDRDNLGNPLNFQIIKNGFVISGQTKSININVGNFVQFREVLVPAKDITQILEISDSQGNLYYEVDNLYQNVIYQAVNNTSRNTEYEPEQLLKQIYVQRRFTQEFQLGSRFTKLTFGSGDPSSTDIDSIPNPGNFSTPLFGKTTFSNFTIDPYRFTQTSTLGIGPANTNITIRFRFGGGSGHNVAENNIRKIKIPLLQEPHPNAAITSAGLRKSIVQTLSVINPDPANGGTDPPTLDDVRIAAPANYAAQSRTVTAPDFIARILSLPQSFGSVFRVSAQRSKFARGTMDIRVVSKDKDGRLITTPESVKKNIAQLLSPNRMLTDNIQILDTQIINLGLEVSLVKAAGVNIDSLRVNVLRALKNFLDINNLFIGQHLIEDEIRSVVFNIAGVAAVNEIKFTNIRGTIDGYVYSNTRFDIPPPAERRGILECPKSGIFEFRFSERDIKASIR